MRLSKTFRRLSPGAIVASVALFLAASGAALAVTGSGTFQKENEIGIAQDPSPGELVRTIAGVGELRVQCSEGPYFPVLLFVNTSGEALQVRVDRGDGLSVIDSAAPLVDGDNFSFGLIPGDKLYQYHVFPNDGSKTPQADFAVSVDHTGDCETTQVAVLSITTTASGSGTVAGSGTVQKGSLLNVPASTTTVRSVTGVGAVRADCSGGVPVVRLLNTSGETLTVFVERVFAEALGADFAETLNHNQERADTAIDVGVFRYYALPADGTKRPQADITVSVDDTDDCSTTRVAVLDVTTED